MNEQLAAIRARREAVTPGVWSASWAWGKSGEVYNAWAEAPFTSGTCLEDVAPQAEADAAFIAAAPADIDTLLAMVDALTVCAQCGGTGVVDSGGFTPWGAPIDIECSGCFGHATVESAVSEISRLRLAVDALTAERDALAAQLAQAQRELAAADMALMDAIHERE